MLIACHTFGQLCYDSYRPPAMPGLTPSNMLFWLGKYTTLPLRANVLATSLAASMRRNSIKPGPAVLVASEMSLADSLSPSALMTAAFLSCDRSDKGKLAGISLIPRSNQVVSWESTNRPTLRKGKLATWSMQFVHKVESAKQVTHRPAYYSTDHDYRRLLHTGCLHKAAARTR